MNLRIVELPSPNFNDRPDGVAPTALVMHYTGLETLRQSLDILTDGAREKRVSSHYTIDEDGTIYAHVPEARRAWHAGVSWWRGAPDLNSRSIGIEIQNPGHEWGYRPFPDAQIEAVIALSKGILSRWRISPRDVVGHSDIAPARKDDPGELFPWARLAAAGIGLWPSRTRQPIPEAGVPRALAAIGYGVAPDVEVPLDVVVRAFQRRWSPHRLDGVADERTRAAMAAVVEIMAASPF